MVIVSWNFPFAMNFIMASLSWCREISFEILFADYGKSSEYERKTAQA